MVDTNPSPNHNTNPNPNPNPNPILINPKKAFFKKKINPGIDPDPDSNPVLYCHPTRSWS